MNEAKARAVVADIEAVCQHYGVMLVGTCEDESVYGEITIHQKGDMDSEWITCEEHSSQQFKSAKGGDYEVDAFGTGDVDVQPSINALIPADCDARKIMLDVTPGEDGEGHEVYARNIADVENLLNKHGLAVEELEEKLVRARKEVLSEALTTISKLANDMRIENGNGGVDEAMSRVYKAVQAIQSKPQGEQAC